MLKNNSIHPSTKQEGKFQEEDTMPAFRENRNSRKTDRDRERETGKNYLLSIWDPEKK
jgi:hypothetical protein